MGRRLIPCFALACVLAPAAAFTQPDTVLADAERLIRAGRAAEAYRQLGAQEAALAGEPLFDYLYGVAALDAGQLGPALAALRRLVLNQPDSAPARLELGRAYVAAGDRAAAERQFQEAIARNPSPATRDAAQSWLAALRAPAPSGASGWHAGYEFGAGLDSNANASTEDTSFLGILLDPTNVAQSSSYLTAAGWFAYGGRLGNGRIETRGRIGHRWNPDADWVDQSIASLGTRLSFGDGDTVFGVGLGGWYGLLDGDPHHWNASIDLSLSRRFGDGWRATSLLRGGQLRYEESDFPGLSVLDMDQLTAAFSLQRALDSGHFGITLFGGTEDEQQPGSPFGNERLGLLVYGGARNTAGNDFGLQFGWQDVRYDDSPGFFGGLDRADTIWSAAFTLDVHDWPARGITLTPHVGWTVNTSNIALYEYHRFEAGLTLMRSFR